MITTRLFLLSLATSISLYASTISSTPTDSSLIVYNGNIGLVHEDKKIKLTKGVQAVVYKDVAQTVQTDSVNITFPSGVKLYSQQYRFDKITTAKLLDAHIGKAVKVKVANNSDEFTIYDATLISSNGHNCIVKTAKGEIFSTVSSKIIFNSIPDTLITKPSLVWNIDATRNVDGKVSLDYLINNITWQSNYILNLKDNMADLTGWITVDNRSGKRFDSVNLNVLAGDINRAKKRVEQRSMYKAVAMVMEDNVASHVSHEGYHLYTIPFRVTLANNEKTQLKFIDEKQIPIKRRYEARLNHPNYLHSEVKHKVSQFVEIKSLELPLPSGVVRSYSKSKDITLLLGENRIDHTPKHEKISLRLGTNFDMKVNEKVIDRNDDKYYFDERISYEVINRSDVDQTIELLVPFTKSSNAKASLNTNQPYIWKDGNTIKFSLLVKADSEKSFEVHYRSRR